MYQQILAANEAFYAAFAERDLDAMTQIWSRDAEVVCVHPGWEPLEGYRAVLESWRDIMGNPESPEIRCRDARAYLHGEFGFVVCYEVLPDGVLIATNIFALEQGEWRLVHHQAGPAAAEAPSEERPTGTVH